MPSLSVLTSLDVPCIEKIQNQFDELIKKNQLSLPRNEQLHSKSNTLFCCSKNVIRNGQTIEEIDCEKISISTQF